MRVVKTYPCEDHTLRHLKCRSCGTNVFTHEYIMVRDEYTWHHGRPHLNPVGFE